MDGAVVDDGRWSVLAVSSDCAVVRHFEDHLGVSRPVLDRVAGLRRREHLQWRRSW